MSGLMGGVTVVPKSLPPYPRGFVDRIDELKWVQDTIANSLARLEQCVLVFTGLPGVGKTTLLARCAHEVHEQYVDQVLRAELGASAEAATVDEVLISLLHQLGVENVPSTSPGLRMAYQHATADRRLLVLLDDVESAMQVRNLLPASSHSAVLATSRRRSEGFARERFDILEVSPFAPEISVEMMLSDITATRTAVDAEAVRTLTELAGHLPLALTVMGAHLKTHCHSPIADYVGRLRSVPILTELTIDGEQLVREVFEISYQDLTAEGKRTYHLVSLHPGRCFSLSAAAALLEVEPSEARRLLNELLAANLLHEVDQDRFEFHNLVQQHAIGHARHTEHPADCRAAVGRVGEHYLRFVVARERVLSDRARLGEYFDGRVPAAYSGPDGWQRAIADLELERATLLRAVEALAEDQFHDLVWQLCEALATFYFQRDHFGDGVAAYTIGLRSARESAHRTGDGRPVLRMLASLGTAHFSAQRNDEALTHFDEAASLAEAMPADDPMVLNIRADMYMWKSFVHQRREEFDTAVASIACVRAIADDPRFPEATRARTRALTDMNGATMLSGVGRHDEAVAAGRRAVAFFSDGKESANAAKSLANLGRCLLRAGPAHLDDGINTLRSAIEILAELGMGFWEADTSEILAEVLENTEQAAETRALLERASLLLRPLDPQRAEKLRKRLGED